MKPARLILLFSIGGISILIAVLLLSGRCSLAVISQDLHDGTQFHPSKGHAVGQSFTSHFPGLSEIAVKPSNPKELQSAVVHLYLMNTTSDAEEETRMVQAPIGEFLKDDWLRFTFKPLDFSKERNYVFLIEPDGSASIGLLSHAENLYPEGDCTEGGDLVFEIRYHGKCIPTIETLLERLSEKKPGLMGNPIIYVILFAMVQLAAAGTLVSSLKDSHS